MEHVAALPKRTGLFNASHGGEGFHPDVLRAAVLADVDDAAAAYVASSERTQLSKYAWDDDHFHRGMHVVEPASGRRVRVPTPDAEFVMAWAAKHNRCPCGPHANLEVFSWPTGMNINPNTYDGLDNATIEMPWEEIACVLAGSDIACRWPPDDAGRPPSPDIVDLAECFRVNGHAAFVDIDTLLERTWYCTHHVGRRDRHERKCNAYSMDGCTCSKTVQSTEAKPLVEFAGGFRPTLHLSVQFHVITKL